MADQSIVQGTTAPLTANDFTRVGFTFSGWATTATGTVAYADESDYTMGNSGVILYAVWIQNPSYTVTFDKNNGTGTMSPQAIVQGTTVVLAANLFTRTGYQFSGWATTATDTVAYVNKANFTMGAGDVILYAVWTQNPSYSITFDPNGGDGTMSAQSIVQGTSAALTGNAFVRTGYQFAGWAITASGAVAYSNQASYTMGAGNVTLYAKWTGVWSLSDEFSTTSELSRAVLGAGEKVYFAQQLSYDIYLQTINSNGIVTNVSSCASRYIDRLGIALGSDESTIFIGSLTTLVSWNGTGWSYIDTTTTWYSVGGYSLQIGSANTPYVAAMEGIDLRVRKFNGVSWQIIGSDMSLPLNPNGDMNFCITSTETVYTIGTDWDNPGISTANLENTTWNIVQVEATDADRNSEQIISYGNNVYVGYVDENNSNPSIYRLSNGAWTKLASMANSTSSGGSLSIACSPSGELYAGHIEGSNVVIKKYTGSTWQNVPSNSNGTAFTVSSGNNLQVLPGTDKCYAFVRTSSGLSIYMLPLK